ncbi:hypothetical protein Q4519_14200 [Motilimonas sp. 1_MG-2023]|uniref:hypothetical protein n=1 Tax=Motilimonas sp. 1_MG-2023 TaxID=3062672 RepID=UPI0026E3C33B|nr:hypothetical protein [Motilimonas sp. 1_MG-2023]MDO6526836.1 hypothetical protein [Motilimonas sp. 1_MG-2023]
MLTRLCFFSRYNWVVNLVLCSSFTLLSGCSVPSVWNDEAEVTQEIQAVAPVSGDMQISTLTEQQVKFTVLASLPSDVSETSGLAMRYGKLWTINDSGDGAFLYKLNLSNQFIETKLKVTDAVNRDWESLAQDDTYLYIADCGNNSGKRDTFQIYQVPWHEIDIAPNGSRLSSDRINIKLEKQTADLEAYEHNYDCEAITMVDNQLWLFSKNWQDQQTQLYQAEFGTSPQLLKAQQTLPVQGLITAVDYHQPSGQLALLGYSKQRLFGHAFIWIFDVVGGEVDLSHAKYYQLPEYSQWEGLLWKNDKTLLISAESSPLSSAALAEVVLPSH